MEAGCYTVIQIANGFFYENGGVIAPLFNGKRRMSMTESYLDMMQESLQKKIIVLKQIEKENELQRQILEKPDHVDGEAFDQAVERKGRMIDELTELNDGFQSLYDQIKPEIEQNRNKYKNEIRIMQEMIREITTLSSSLEAEEMRNKKMADAYFSETRKQYKNGKRSAKVALDYYQNMSKSKSIQPQFIDQKN